MDCFAGATFGAAKIPPLPPERAAEAISFLGLTPRRRCAFILVCLLAASALFRRMNRRGRFHRVRPQSGCKALVYFIAAAYRSGPSAGPARSSCASRTSARSALESRSTACGHSSAARNLASSLTAREKGCGLAWRAWACRSHVADRETVLLSIRPQILPKTI